VQPSLGSRRCRRAHAVDGILACSRAACSWLTVLSACSCSRCHSHLQPCSLLLAHRAVGVLMRSMAFSLAAVQLALGSRPCRRAHAVDGILTCSRAACSWLTALSACSCSRWHSYLQPWSLHWLTALSAYSCSRWHSQSQPCSLHLAHGAVGVIMHCVGPRRCQPAHAVDGILTCSRAACVGSLRYRHTNAVDGILISSRAACSLLTALSACLCGRWHSHMQP
jgi:transposase